VPGYVSTVQWTPVRIRLFRQEGLCLPQDRFARVLGFEKRTVGNAERGAHPPSLSLRRALDQALEDASEAQRERFFAALAAASVNDDTSAVNSRAAAVESVELISRTEGSDPVPGALDQIEELVGRLGVDYSAVPLAEFRERVLTWRRYVAHVERLTSLTDRVDEVTWWAPWAQVVPDWLKIFLGLEALAERMFVFEPVLIPGLLQIEDYARAVTADTPRVRPDHRDRFVDLRRARARRFTDPDRPLHLHAVIAEAALRLRVGTWDLQRAQLEHLLVMSELPTVTIQILRPEDGLHTATTGFLAVLEFENARSIGYTELHDGAVYVQDPDQARCYAMTAENLERVALGPDQSVALIKSAIER